MTTKGPSLSTDAAGTDCPAIRVPPKMDPHYLRTPEAAIHLGLSSWTPAKRRL